MILYHVVSTYHLLNAIVHRLRINDSSECVLMISDWLVDKFPQYNELEKYFNEIIVKETSKFPFLLL